MNLQQILAEQWRVKHEMAIEQAEKSRAEWKKLLPSILTPEEFELREEAGLITIGLPSREEAHLVIAAKTAEIEWHRQVIVMLADKFRIDKGDYLVDETECEACQGTGKMRCHACRGENNRCEVCRGTGDIKCATCYGRGSYLKECEK
jgi:hypothetical protein